MSTMFALVRLCFLFLILQSSAAEAELSPPRDLHMITLNTNYSLAWNWDQSSAGSDSVDFTVQYAGNHQMKKKNPKWKTACEETPARSCDLTGLSLHYLGLYMLRVRANLNGRHSAWVFKQFCPDKEAAIGPPSKVRLAAAIGTLDIFISDPVTSSNTSMKDVIKDLKFKLLYWEEPEAGKGLTPETLSINVNVVTLSDLKPRTRYCVTVQSLYDFYNKTSSFTPPLCTQTQGVTEWWKIFLYFLGSLLIFFLLMLLIIYCGHQCFQLVKATFFPGEKLPSIFIEPEADYSCLIFSDPEGDLCDPVIVSPESAPPEMNVDPAVDSAAPPADLDQDSSGRHSRQNSSSSGDSGVYSAGGNSGAMQQNVASSSFRGTKFHFDSEKVKMLDINSEFKVSPVVADEGVVDMEV